MAMPMRIQSRIIQVSVEVVALAVLSNNRPVRLVAVAAAPSLTMAVEQEPNPPPNKVDLEAWAPVVDSVMPVVSEQAHLMLHSGAAPSEEEPKMSDGI